MHQKPSYIKGKFVKQRAEIIAQRNRSPKQVMPIWIESRTKIITEKHFESQSSTFMMESLNKSSSATSSNSEIG